MEFAIAQGFDLDPVVGVAERLATSTVKLETTLVRLGTVSAVSTQHPVSGDSGSCYFFDGHVSLDEEFVHPLLEPSPAQISRVVDVVLAGRMPDGGVFVTARVDARGAGRLVMDPNGQYPVYLLRRGRDFIVSNNIHFVATAARASGLTLTRSLVPAIDNILFTGPLSGATSFEEVSWLLPGQSVRFDQSTFDIVDTHASDVAASPVHGPEQLVKEAVDAMSRHAVSVRRALPDAIAVADVTGGTNTRAVLAVLTSTQAYPDLTGRCTTRYPDPDANAAGCIMEHLGLRPGPYPARAGLAEAAREILAITVGAHRHGGAVDPMRILPFSITDLVHFEGTFGELCGYTPGSDYMSTADPEGAPPFSGPVETVREHRARTNIAVSLLTRSAVAMAGERFRAEILHLAELGVDRGQIAAEVYMRSRCKSHYGLRSTFFSRSLIHPDVHTNPWLVPLRRALPERAHRANKGMLDIVLSARPDLAFLPMLKPWDENIVPREHRTTWAGMRKVDRSLANLSGYSSRLWRRVPVPAPQESTAVTDRWVPGERTRNVPGVAMHAMLSDILGAAPSGHDLWRYFARPRVEELVRDWPTDLGGRRGRRKALGRVVTGMVWALGMESHEQVTTQHSMYDLLHDSGMSA